MKAYEPQQLMAISRYQNCFPSLPEEIREDVYARMRKLCNSHFFRHETDAGDGWDRSKSV